MNKIYSHFKIPPALKKMHNIFSEHGFKSYLVGGAVRDMIMNVSPNDYDVATDAYPDEVIKLFNHVIPTGIAHGTVTVFLQGYKIETTTFRSETEYSDGRHPDKISYVTTIEDDLSRRDFTMNAVAIDIENKSIVDPFKGQLDIKAKIIRAVGNAKIRFQEDGLRPIRAIRFATQLNFAIEENTYKSISEKETLEVVKKISIERFRDEFIKILISDEPSIGLKMLEETGILKIFLPELLECRNCLQADIRGYHEFDVLDHLYYACDGAPKDNLTVRLASLFHDIGKVKARKVVTTEIGEVFTFHNHETFSTKITETILLRLRFPSKTIFDVLKLIENHMFHYEESWTDSAVRRFIVRAGKEYIDDLFDLRLADIFGKHRMQVRLHDTTTGKNLVDLKNRIEKVQKENIALSLKDLDINGNDLINIGIKDGKEIGRILKELFNAVLDDPSINKKEQLLTIAKNICIK